MCDKSIDLVIGVDTAVTHLQVLWMFQFGQCCSTTPIFGGCEVEAILPWYRSMTLIRQRKARGLG